MQSNVENRRPRTNHRAFAPMRSATSADAPTCWRSCSRTSTTTPPPIRRRESSRYWSANYIDSGPQSRRVLDILVARSRCRQLVYLKGSHETSLPDFLHNPATLGEWRCFGGLETLV